MYCVYVLYSAKYDKIYIGYTSNLIARFHGHNSLSPTGFTKRFRPWVVVHVDFYDSKKEAMIQEKRLKGGQGRQWIKDDLLLKAKTLGLISA